MAVPTAGAVTSGAIAAPVPTPASATAKTPTIAKAAAHLDSTPVRTIPCTYSRIEPLESTAVPTDSELSVLRIAKEILTMVKPGSDVTNINLPANILDPVSTLEKTKKSMQRGELLSDICASADPVERFLNILRFNFSGLARERFGKKPFNPVLGEVYRCCFVHRADAGHTLLVAEQVSHHPPITALHLRNDTLGFYMNSYTAPEPRFWGNSLEVKLAGEICITLDKFDSEEYIITRPDIYMTGFFAGRQKLEFNGTSTFRCAKTALAADIEYKAKGSLAFRAEMNGISGRVYRQDSGETLYTLEGRWDDTIVLTDVSTGETREFFDYKTVVRNKSMVAVLPPEDELEDSYSTRVWAHCASAIVAGESGAANSEKRKVEDHERSLRKERMAARVEWQYRYFQKRNDGRVGYELRSDLQHMEMQRIADIKVSAEDLEGLKSGEVVEEFQAEANGDGGVGDNGRRKKIRPKLLSRSRVRS